MDLCEYLVVTGFFSHLPNLHELIYGVESYAGIPSDVRIQEMKEEFAGTEGRSRRLVVEAECAAK